jgi:PPOX class probable F420-dependent enzyme
MAGRTVGCLRRLNRENAMQKKPFSDPEIQSILEGPVTAVLATINPDGSPLATPMWYVHDASGIGMVSVDALQKIRNLRSDPRVSVVVESVAADGPQCVIVQGRVEFLDTQSDRSSLGAAFVDKYGENIEKRWGGRAVPDDRALFRVHPRRVKLWG